MLGSWGEPCLAEYLVSKAKTLQEGRGVGAEPAVHRRPWLLRRGGCTVQSELKQTHWCHACIV